MPAVQRLSTLFQDKKLKNNNKKLRKNQLLVPNEVLFWPKLKPAFGVEDPKSPVPVLGVAVAAAAPKRPPVPAAMGLEGPFLPAW